MKKKILVVDDEPTVIKLLEIKLQQWGYDVVSTTDPNKCSQMVEKEHPDLILLDIMMPDVDGISVCSKLIKTYDLPVVMVSALDNPLPQHAAKLSGAFGYITKPIDDKELKSKIEKALKPGSE